MTFPLDPAAPVPPDGENPIRDMNPYRYEGANLMSRAAWDSGSKLVRRRFPSTQLWHIPRYIPVTTPTTTR